MRDITQNLHPLMAMLGKVGDHPSKSLNWVTVVGKMENNLLKGG